MSVILCRRERVSHPFFIESLGIRVGSSQELCYAFYHHPLLLIDDLVGQDLMDFYPGRVRHGSYRRPDGEMDPQRRESRTMP